MDFASRVWRKILAQSAGRFRINARSERCTTRSRPRLTGLTLHLFALLATRPATPDHALKCPAAIRNRIHRPPNGNLRSASCFFDRAHVPSLLKVLAGRRDGAAMNPVPNSGWGAGTSRATRWGYGVDSGSSCGGAVIAIQVKEVDSGAFWTNAVRSACGWDAHFAKHSGPAAVVRDNERQQIVQRFPPTRAREREVQ
jgi:hypothetical protein